MRPFHCESRSLPLALAIGLALATGCGGGTTTTSQGSGQSSAASSGGGSIGASSGAASSGASTGSSTAVGSSTGGSNTGAATTTGTGTAGRPSDFVDGGYVFCSEQVVTDAGSGMAEWMCPPGTYFCQSPGSCAQCLSDTDCANVELPTYEPSRSRCDLDSGVTGYQNFCRRCTRDADCAGNGLATMCDLNPSDAVPSIDEIGFETCADLGPGCLAGTQPAIGGCASTSCTTDSDCADAVSNLGSVTLYGYSAQEAEPFCVKGQCTVSANDVKLCPNCYCISDSYCPDPKAVCDLLNDHCACVDSSQCGGAWPICEIPQGADVDDAGQPLGLCGCKSDGDCGDAGLRCLVLPADNVLYGGPACLFACTDPRFPGCANLSPTTPLCDVQSGLCVPCETDQQCQTLGMGSFVGPFCRDDGMCGCQRDSDCPDHEACGGPVSQGESGGLLGQCTAPPLRCTPESCTGSSFCDLDGGACEPIAGSRVCESDADCAYVSGGAFCDSDAGSCVYCSEDVDCSTSGFAAAGYSYCLAGSCSALCAADQDCAGNPTGEHCVANPSDASSNHCGCVQDQDCAGNSHGSRCETDAGTCSCFDATDCPAGQSCRGFGPLRCTSYCEGDSECPAGFFCSESGCLPRCDDGGAGCLAPFLACDRNNLKGGNGAGAEGAFDPGAVWCYQCLTGDDCDPDQACPETFCSTSCYGQDSCHAGEACGVVDRVCHASCDAGACPAGQTCDLEDSTGNGEDLCYQCLSASDCPGAEGCNSRTHSCGSCLGPTAAGGSADCPPGAICSDYWSSAHNHIDPVCLQNCDVFACANPNDICAVFPQLTPDHRYCFGCLQDSDCADAGAGARCDNSLGLTFTCKLPTAP